MPPLSPPVGEESHKDYLLDMLEQLAAMARDIGEAEVAIHLDATAAARRFTLQIEERRDPML